MASMFFGAAASSLRSLAEAFRSGRLTDAATGLSINRVAPCSEAVVAHIVGLLKDGLAPRHLALLLESRAEVAEAGLANEQLAELVWTGPEGQGAFCRDTSVVVRELFQTAERTVLVSTFVVRQVATVFQVLAQRMDERPELDVDLFLHVGRAPRDTRYESEILREVAARFRADWPGARLPKVYYAPRGLAAEPASRATWHAKCVVTDESAAFVTSANFTDWAHERNVEAGVLVRDRAFAGRLAAQFAGLVQSRQVLRLQVV